MPETKPKRVRVRDRSNYVMVELTAEERAKLERLRTKRSANGERISLAGTFRYLLAQAK